MNQGDYNYESAGFDGFLSRSIDNLSRTNLAAQGPTSTAIRYDSAQVSGMLGNTLVIGKILLDGVTGRITVVDDNGNEMVKLGNIDD